MNKWCRPCRIVVLLLLSLVARNTVSLALDPDPAVASMLSQVEQSRLYTYVGQLSGEFPAQIGDEPYTIRSRNTLHSGDGILKATQFAYEHMESLGLSTSYQSWTGCGVDTDISSRNVIGERAGTTRPDEVVLMMAHVDNMPASSLSYGADDNASGSAAVLVAADLLSRHSFQRTIRFLLTTGEEQGLCGARAYAAMARARNDSIVAVYNMDMIGWDSTGAPTARVHIRTPDRPGYDEDRAIAYTFVDVVHAYGLNLAPIIAADYSYSVRNADQVLFWDYGYPGILAIEDNLSDFNRFNYHTLNDRLNTLNLQYLTSHAKAAVGTVAHLAYILPSALELTLSGGGAIITQTIGSSGTTGTGYAAAKVVSDVTPYGVAVFTFTHNGSVVSEAGVPATPPTNSARVFVDYRSAIDAVPSRSEAGAIDINTGIAVVNYGSSTADMTYVLRDLNGNTLSAGHGTVAAGNHFACFIDQLKERAASDFDLPVDFASTIQFGSLEITSDQPLSVLALRGTTNQRNDYLITTTPVADLQQPLNDTPIYFPQFVDGGGYTTSLILMNTSDKTETGRFQIMNANGEPVVVHQAGGASDSSFEYSILPGGVFRFQTDGSPTETKAGWVRLIPDAGTSAPIGSGVFGYNPTDVLLTESGIPAAVATTHARVFVDLSGNHNTGLAIANIADSDAAIAIRAFQMDGSTEAGNGNGPVPMPARGYAAAFADQFVTGLPEDFTGVLDISSTMPFAALTLRSLVNEREEFLMTAFPIADANRAAPSPIVFPHIAEGGEYVTRFIFLSPAGESGVTLNFYDEAGRPWAVGEAE